MNRMCISSSCSLISVEWTNRLKALRNSIHAIWTLVSASERPSLSHRALKNKRNTDNWWHTDTANKGHFLQLVVFQCAP